jgi:hypothetical protein
MGVALFRTDKAQSMRAIEPFTEIKELIGGNFKFLTQVAT